MQQKALLPNFNFFGSNKPYSSRCELAKFAVSFGRAFTIIEIALLCRSWLRLMKLSVGIDSGMISLLINKNKEKKELLTRCELAKLVLLFRAFTIIEIALLYRSWLWLMKLSVGIDPGNDLFANNRNKEKTLQVLAIFVSLNYLVLSSGGSGAKTNMFLLMPLLWTNSYKVQSKNL